MWVTWAVHWANSLGVARVLEITTFGSLFHLGAGYEEVNGAFTLDVKSVVNKNLGGILGGTQC